MRSPHIHERLDLHVGTGSRASVERLPCDDSALERAKLPESHHPEQPDRLKAPYAMGAVDDEILVLAELVARAVLELAERDQRAALDPGFLELLGLANID